MKVIVDGFGCTGATHQICDDTILFGIEPIPYIIIADGCSSSERTDFGSRILAHSAEKFIKLIFKDNCNWILNSDFEIKLFGSLIIEHAKDMLKEYNLKSEVLDSTLVILFMWGDKFHLFMYGDGCVFVKDTNGSLIYKRVFYESNAPYYLTYLIDDERKDKYWKFIENPTMYVENSFGIATLPVDKYYHFSFPVGRTDLIGISSDGIETFKDIETGNEVPLHDMLQKLTAFKNYGKHFVTRRLKRIKKDYLKENIDHGDDLSFGVMKIVEEEIKNAEVD